MNRAAARLLLLLLALSLPWTAVAVQPDEVMSDRALEERARVIGKSLRCLVCQNQSIDDSDADLARDLRLIVRERLQAGDSDVQVIAYVTARYGDFVLLKPPFKPATWLLWLGPAGVLLLAAGAVVVSARRRGARAIPEAPLSDEERRRLAALLKDER